ncbi:MAG: hypothetical protein KatS3mg115_1686 [Candidatus Poribacteria bacterium]|nr:MAG: hypothetical protein KatS3mg115_1686 [Candidatus Poribacteria bacterium]
MRRWGSLKRLRFVLLSGLRWTFRLPAGWIVLAWTLYRLGVLVAIPGALDPRERIVAQEALRWAQGAPLTVFHWPGVPWVWTLRMASRFLGFLTPEPIAYLGRLLATLSGSGALLALMALGRRWGLERLRWALLVVAVSPAFSAGEANLALVDLPALCLGLLGLLAASDRKAFLAGLLLGLAGAVKLPSLALLAPALLLVGAGPSRIGLLLLGTGGGFLLGFPQIVRPGALEGLAYELGHYRKGHFGLFSTAEESGFASLLSPLLRHLQAAAWGLGFLGPLVLLLALRRRGETFRQEEALLAWLFVALAPILVQRFSFPRHWLLSLPPLALLAARRVPWPLLAVASVWSLATTLALNGIAVQPGTVQQAEADLAALRRDRPEVVLSYGPRPPVFEWLYPPTVIRHGVPSPPAPAEWVVVAKLEREVQRRIAERPGQYREEDFFPLSRERFTTGSYFQTLEREAVLERRYRAMLPAWVCAVAFLGCSPPFPLNALHHPELELYRVLSGETAHSVR